ncbi:hypothetical protein PV08_09814 [Exophiala spinifera]|uniref:BTB domain-containing protein n=1 Tax=Exophiala spinifera TaxID=91928 RepID=A0A0D1ZI43_9EURO|nr:uncharacterized protein PV08_09814 [Exophiala spinifera]KIW12537.1 hypothetical protein PV08_09814 [Exophiala spinifera]
MDLGDISVHPPRVPHGSSMVDVMVGNIGGTRDAKFFTIHDRLLSASSPVFKDAIDNSHDFYHESIKLERSHGGQLGMKIPDEEAAIFQLFYDWLYSGRVPASLGQYLTRDFQSPDEFWWEVLLFAERYEISRLTLLATNSLQGLFSSNEPLVPSSDFMGRLFSDDVEEHSCLRKYVSQHVAFWLEKSADREIWYARIQTPQAAVNYFAHAVTRNDGSHPMFSKDYTRDCKYACPHYMASILEQEDKDLRDKSFDSRRQIVELESAELIEPISEDDDTGTVKDAIPQAKSSHTKLEDETWKDTASAPVTNDGPSRPPSRVISEHSPLSNSKPTTAAPALDWGEPFTPVRDDAQHNKESWNTSWATPIREAAPRTIPATTRPETPTNVGQNPDPFIEPNRAGVAVDNAWNVRRPVVPGPHAEFGAQLARWGTRPLYVPVPVPFHGAAPPAVPYRIPGPAPANQAQVVRHSFSTHWNPPTRVAAPISLRKDWVGANRNDNWELPSQPPPASENGGRRGQRGSHAKGNSSWMKNGGGMAAQDDWKSEDASYIDEWAARVAGGWD